MKKLIGFRSLCFSYSVMSYISCFSQHLSIPDGYPSKRESLKRHVLLRALRGEKMVSRSCWLTTVNLRHRETAG
ncbi:hypothetical protein M758_1G006300 [Ceratodon purpureus]|uniref:Uncharacterized protein n=1 Tax=Ceratodon purpureus TaxID=3225 RepID=A0A8T0J305_CERPU|nr:hypothetical protein KC19_1G007400 [Ceratodon purpureus]KAG0628167.1 hypothetical protein M758_1G006300 [Ceratodon purpureus]